MAAHLPAARAGYHDRERAGDTTWRKPATDKGSGLLGGMLPYRLLCGGGLAHTHERDGAADDLEGLIVERYDPMAEPIVVVLGSWEGLRVAPAKLFKVGRVANLVETVELQPSAIERMPG